MVNRSVWRFPGAFRRSAAIMLAAVMLLATALAGVLYLPEMTENGQKKKNGTVVDAGHANEGYVYVKHRESKKRLKLRIASGGETYTYDLNQNGEFELFPLQMGSGTYKISVYEQVRGTQYCSQLSPAFPYPPRSGPAVSRSGCAGAYQGHFANRSSSWPYRPDSTS